MKSAHSLGLGALLALLVVAPSAGASARSEASRGVDEACRFEGHPLWGKVKVVDSFPDVKVKVVDSFPDLRVKHVDAFPDDCGEWKMVDSFPDVKVQFVDSFPDVKIRFVDSFPGRP